MEHGTTINSRPFPFFGYFFGKENMFHLLKISRSPVASFHFPSECPKKIYVSTLPWMNAGYFQPVSVKLNAPGGPRVVRSPSGAQRAGRLPVTWWMFFKAWRFSSTGNSRAMYIYILYIIYTYFNIFQLYLCIWVHLILGVPMFFFVCVRGETQRHSYVHRVGHETMSTGWPSVGLLVRRNILRTKVFEKASKGYRNSNAPNFDGVCHVLGPSSQQLQKQAEHGWTSK